MERHSYRIVLSDLPETLRKPSLSTNFPYQEIRWNCGILCSDYKRKKYLIKVSVSNFIFLENSLYIDGPRSPFNKKSCTKSNNPNIKTKKCPSGFICKTNSVEERSDDKVIKGVCRINKQEGKTWCKTYKWFVMFQNQHIKFQTWQ